MSRLTSIACLVTAVLLAADALRGVEPITQSETVTIRVVDANGEPVAGAKLALQRDRYREDEGGGREFVNRWVKSLIERDRTDDGATSDAQGESTEARAALVQAAYGRPLTFWAVDDASKTVGITVVDPTEIPDTVTVVLRQGVRLSATMNSTSLRAAGREPRNYRVWVRARDNATLIIDDRNDPHFEALLPPGDYELLLNIAGAYVDVQEVTLRPEKPVDLDVDLTARRIYSLLHKPAPELGEMVEWRNAPAGGLSLEGLRGKVVLLQFWGAWCGPCVHKMPDLMALHDELGGSDFEIIALHDATEPSFEGVFKKLADIKRDVWGGRDLPFPLALDGGGEVQVPDAPAGTVTAGRTNAEYGITSYPTGVVIGRDGTVLRTIDVRDQTDVEWLRELVTGQNEPTTRPSR